MFTWTEKFNCNLNNWKINKNASMKNMFDSCQLQDNPPAWYKE
jgi:hypothetical protein